MTDGWLHIEMVYPPTTNYDWHRFTVQCFTTYPNLCWWWWWWQSW